MEQIYLTYLFYKDIEQTLKNKLIFLWSKVILIVTFNSFLLKPSRSKYLKIKYLIGAYTLCIKHIKDIKKGDLDFFNKELR